MNRRMESSQPQDQQQQQQQQETSGESLIPPTPSGSSSEPQQQQNQQSQPQQPVDEAELQRQENLRQFNILLTPAFAAFSHIIDGLFLTGVGGMSVDNFRRNKITNIINCTHEAPNWRLSGVDCYRIPIDDTPLQDLTPFLDRAVEKIDSILSSGGRVVVHCVAGVSRSAAIVVAYLIKHKKMTLHDAYNHVQSCRRVIRPNNGFFNQLIAYEMQVLGTSSVKMVKIKRDDVTIEVPDFFETEHRKFVLLETFKAKASSLKAIVQSGASPVVHSTQPIPANTNKGIKMKQSRSPSKLPSKSPSKCPSKMPSKLPSKLSSHIPSHLHSQLPSNTLSTSLSQAPPSTSPKNSSQCASQTPPASPSQPPSQPPTQN